jgi:hypothetical protein
MRPASFWTKEPSGAREQPASSNAHSDHDSNFMRPLSFMTLFFAKDWPGFYEGRKRNCRKAKPCVVGAPRDLAFPE